MTKIVIAACQDCTGTFEHLHRSGCVPKRCGACRLELSRRRRRAWYEANREHALAYAARRWLASRPAIADVACEDCGAGLSGGRPRYCDQCRQRRVRENKARYREGQRATLRAKGSEYARNRRDTEPGYRQRQRELAALRLKEHPEAVRESRKRSYERHAESRRASRRDRAQRKRRAIYQRDQAVCHICQGHVAWADFELDHVVPASRGGSGDEINLATSHMTCNRRKSARLLEEMV